MGSATPMRAVALDPKAGFALFSTAIGRCGVAWGPAGITAVQLPEVDEAATRARLLRRAGGGAEAIPPRPVADAVREMTALLASGPSTLAEIALDWSGLPPFHIRVYEAARAIGPGETVTYGDLARRLGSPGGARAVGQALGKNPFAIVVPCHRVLAAGGKPGGFSAVGGAQTKLRMLAIERVRGLQTTLL